MMMNKLRSDMDMIIKAVTARAVNVPLEYPLRTAVGTIATSPLVLIDIETNAGIQGRSYIFAYILPALRPLAPLVLDAFLDNRLRLVGNTGLLRMAASGLDMAAWDALARANNVPLAVL